MKNEGRRSYAVDLNINGQKFTEVIIDPHYEEKHADTINDGIILRLVKTLDGRRFTPAEITETYEYYVNDRIVLDQRAYKLIWLLEKDQIFIGVVNAYRRN